MKLFNKQLAQEKPVGEIEVLSDDSLCKVSAGATIPVRRKTPQSPQPIVYTA